MYTRLLFDPLAWLVLSYLFGTFICGLWVLGAQALRARRAETAATA